MTKKELVAAVAKRTKTTRKNAEVIVNAVFATMTDALKEEGRVQITGFGTFEVTERSAREGRNPANGEAVSVEAMKSAKFKASKMLKGVINDDCEERIEDNRKEEEMAGLVEDTIGSVE